jgi:type IV pilus assembly protein PilA
MLNTKTKQSGFTIVELLIVIVVIAILAAISIVAYNGIQNRGKASAAQSLANSVVKKAEAYNTIKSAYPADVAAFSSATDAAEAKLDDPTKVSAAIPTDEKIVQYIKCGTTGAQVGWFDATKASNKVTYISLGGATALAASAGVTSCT